MRRADFTLWAMRQTAVAACLAVLLMASASASDGANSVTTNQTSAQSADFQQPKTFAELLALPTEQLEKVDIARIDLLCAEGLPGAEHLDIEACLQTLDQWAAYVKLETETNYHRFVEHPEKFKNSLGRYRMAVMAAVVSQDLRVQYNPKREKELSEHDSFAQNEPYGEAERSFFSDSSDLFLHGLLSEKRYGTCASMPYLYVAIGRRLGYPVSIAQAHMHGYVYYDEGNGKHFNVEATENRGFVTPSDDEYRNPPWGAPSSLEYYEKRDMLQPLSNKETMGHVLAERSAVFRSAGRHDEEAKTWATAARYFPDTPAWKEIAKNMQQCARLDEYQKWRDGVWKELAAYSIPHGPGYAYLRDKQIKLHLFMDESIDRKAIETAADEYKKELAEFSKTAIKPIDGGPRALNITNQPAAGTLTLFYSLRYPDGNELRVPADFMPPFAHGTLPPELKLRIANSRPQDPDTLLEMMWQHYEHMQAVELARQRGELERIASDNLILISEESIPLEFRRGVPNDLAIKLSGLRDPKDIVIAMWQYKHEHERQRTQIQDDPMGQIRAALRQTGLTDAEMEKMGLLATGLEDTGLASLGIGDAHGFNPYADIPQLRGLAGQGLIPGHSTSAYLATKEAESERINEMNEQMAEYALEQLRPHDDAKPGFVLHYQVVPASVAANNPAVANPLPFGGLMNSPNSALTPFAPHP